MDISSERLASIEKMSPVATAPEMVTWAPLNVMTPPDVYVPPVTTLLLALSTMSYVVALVKRIS